jgi:hypothetical protein
MGLRFYIVGDDGLRRVSLDAMDGKQRLPQFANKRVKAIQAHYQGQGADVRFDTVACYIHFDHDGIVYVPEADLRHAGELTWVAGEIERERQKTPDVTNFDLHRRVRSLKSESQWEPSEAENAAIAADLLGPARPPGTSAIPLATARKTSSLKASTSQNLYLVYCHVSHPEEDEASPQHRHFEFLLTAISPDDAKTKCRAQFAALPEQGELAFRKGTRFFVDHVIEITDVPEGGAMLHHVRYPGELSAVGVALPFGGEGLALYGFDESDDDKQPFFVAD